MSNIDFFTRISQGMDLKAEEITIVGNHVEENLFDVQNVPQEYLERFIDEMHYRFPGEMIELDKLQQFTLRREGWDCVPRTQVYGGLFRRQRGLFSPSRDRSF